MNEERYQHLLAKLLDDELAADEAAEFTDWLSESPTARLEAGRQLLLWDLYAQQYCPERSAEAFAAACQTRLMAEAGPQSFIEGVEKRLRQENSEPRARRRSSLSETWLGLLASLRWVLAGGVALAIVGVGLWLLPATHNEPTLTIRAGTQVALERAGKSLPARDGLKLLPGDLLRISGSNSAAINYGEENTRVTLNDQAELKILAWSQGKRLELRQGKVEATAARQRLWSPMILVTAQAEARVLGTRFTLGATTTATRLDVTEGSVRFTRASDDVAVKVGAGNYAVAAANYEIRAQPLTGSILREYWTNLPGEEDIAFLIGHPAFPDHPSGHEYFNKFATPSHWGTNYGARIYGYLHPPATGEYAFWIAAGDAATFSLSPDDDPDNKQGIAFAVATPPEEWTKDPGQQSLSVPLVAGRKYYLEVLQKQGSTHEDHLAVAWQGPGRQREVIPGEFLSPFKPKPNEKKP